MFIPDVSQSNPVAFERHLCWVDGQNELRAKLSFIDSGQLDSLPVDMQQRFFEEFSTGALLDYKRFEN